MMRNSDLFFSVAKSFQDTRRSAWEAYQKRMSDLEPARGSQLYADESQRTQADFENACAALRAEAGKTLFTALEGMRTANARRGVTPPTPEDVALLQVLKMRENLTADEIVQAANSMTSPAALEALRELNYTRGFVNVQASTFDRGGMTISSVDGRLTEARRTVRDFLDHDTPLQARLYQEHAMHLHGMEVEVPRRALFETKEACFQQLFGVSGQRYSDFVDAVDGGGDA